MIDCGTRTPEALFRLGLNSFDIRNFFITHSHADHIGGLEEIMLMNRYIIHQKPKILITEEYKDFLWNRSLAGGATGNERHGGVNLSFEDLWDIIYPEKMENQFRDMYHGKLGNIDLKLVRTMHIPDNSDSWKDSTWSTGLIVDDRVLFTADTRFDRELVTELDKQYHFECIFHDCQFFTGGVHASMDELKTLPEDIKSRIMLMHYGDNWEDKIQEAGEDGFMGFARQWHFYDFPENT